MIPKFAFELFLFATNINKEICDVLVSSISLFKKLYEERKFDMLCLILDPKFKSLCLILYFIGREEEVNNVEEYDFLNSIFKLTELLIPVVYEPPLKTRLV
jgi:hypothetical protein